MISREESHPSRSRLGKRVLLFDRLDSTNTFALGLAGDPANDGLVILADEQTAGRGQHGRTWSCPGGSGVLMSVLLFPPAPLRRPALLTAWAAVSLCEVIRKTAGLEATIKWPNDLLIDGRKVCGILIEQTRGTVAGIGLNVNQPAEHFAGLDLTQAASLASLTGRQWSCRDVARQLIDELDSAYERLCQGNIAGLEENWRQRVGLVGSQVEMETPTATQRGQLTQLTFDVVGLLLPDAMTLTLAPEAVRHLRECGS